MKKNKILFFLTTLGFALLLVRLAHLQVVRGENFLVMADANRFHSQTLPAPRGVFLDRYQQPLTTNRKLYYKQKDEDAVFSSQELINRDEALKLMIEAPSQVNYQIRRNYPYSWSVAHTLGYTAPVTLDELEEGQAKMEDWTGRLGLERQLQAKLAGKKGKIVYEIDTWGKKQRVIQKDEPKPGVDVSLTIDPYLSQQAYQALGDSRGAVVILDADTGEILSLISKPSFNPNDLSSKLSDPGAELKRQQIIQSYFKDERKIFFNRAVSGNYPPGSVFKLITALAGLDTEALDKNKTVLDEGTLKVGEYEYANWYYTQHGRTEGEVNLVKALARSNDIYFYKAAEWTGADNLAKYARQLGLGQQTGVELSPEAEGLVPDPAWKEKTLGERWYLGNTYHMGIGQGDILVSPIQIAQLVQAISNQGEMCQPTLINRKDRINCQGTGFQEEHLNLVLDGMIQACSEGGTAYPLFKYNSHFTDQSVSLNPRVKIDQGGIACKTGTAEFGPADERGYRKTHAWLAAVAGFKPEQFKNQYEELGCQLLLQEDGELSDGARELERCQWLENIKEHGFPKELVIVTLVESDDEEPFKEGSADAAPVVEEIVDWVNSYR